MDVDAVIARRPAVVCVDELAHTNVPGSRHEKRAEDVRRSGARRHRRHHDRQHPAPGVAQRRSSASPASASARRCRTTWSRTADQIQLVDMSPTRCAAGWHGKHLPGRPGRRVAHPALPRRQTSPPCGSWRCCGSPTGSTTLDDYRRAHRIDQPWPAKERIVVAVTGGAERDVAPSRGAPQRRPARAARRARHRQRRLTNPDERWIARAQQLVRSLGGTFHPSSARTLPGGGRLRCRGQRHDDHRRHLAPRRLRRLFTGTTGERIALAGRVHRRPPRDARAGGAGIGRLRWYASPLGR